MVLFYLLMVSCTNKMRISYDISGKSVRLEEQESGKVTVIINDKDSKGKKSGRTSRIFTYSKEKELEQEILYDTSTEINMVDSEDPLKRKLEDSVPNNKGRFILSLRSISNKDSEVIEKLGLKEAKNIWQQASFYPLGRSLKYTLICDKGVQIYSSSNFDKKTKNILRLAKYLKGKAKDDVNGEETSSFVDNLNEEVLNVKMSTASLKEKVSDTAENALDWIKIDVNNKDKKLVSRLFAKVKDTKKRDDLIKANDLVDLITQIDQVFVDENADINSKDDKIVVEERDVLDYTTADCIKIVWKIEDKKRKMAYRLANNDRYIDEIISKTDEVELSNISADIKDKSKLHKEYLLSRKIITFIDIAVFLNQ